MRNRHSAEGLGAQFQVYSRKTFHDDFAMLQQYLQLQSRKNPVSASAMVFANPESFCDKFIIG